MTKITDLITEVDNAMKFILVGSTHPGNIGASARALKNMGFNKIELVNPKGFPDDKAFYRAKAAKDILEKTKIYSNLKEAVKDCHLVIGTSARYRTVPWPIITAKEAAYDILHNIKEREASVAVVFGREDRGLTNEELSLCNVHVTIESDPGYSSLNLSQAVQIMAYEIRQQTLSFLNSSFSQTWDVPLADSQETEMLITHFDEIMKEVEFYDTENPRKLLTRVRRFFKRSKIDHMEANIFRGLFAAIQKKLRNIS